MHRAQMEEPAGSAVSDSQLPFERPGSPYGGIRRATICAHTRFNTHATTQHMHMRRSWSSVMTLQWCDKDVCFFMSTDKPCSSVLSRLFCRVQNPSCALKNPP